MGVGAHRLGSQAIPPTLPGGAWVGDSLQVLPASLSADPCSSGKQQVGLPVKPLSKKLQREVNANGPHQGKGWKLQRILLTVQIQYLGGIILK